MIDGPPAADAAPGRRADCWPSPTIGGGAVRESRRSSRPGSISGRHAEDYAPRVGDHRGGIADRAAGLVRARPGHRPAAAAQARPRCPATTPGAYRTERIAARAARRHRDPGHAGLPRRHPAGRDRALPAVRLRRVRGVRDPEFSASLPSLLDRGVVYAIAHIRGGGEGGRRWWQQGRLRRQADHVQRLHRGGGLAGGRRRMARRRGGRPPHRVPRAVGRRAAAGRGLLPRARSGGGPSSPRCRSWTA